MRRLSKNALDVGTIERERIPLPFPLEQHELFSGEGSLRCALVGAYAV